MVVRWLLTGNRLGCRHRTVQAVAERMRVAAQSAQRLQRGGARAMAVVCQVMDPLREDGGRGFSLVSRGGGACR